MSSLYKLTGTGRHTEGRAGTSRYRDTFAFKNINKMKMDDNIEAV
jgi:hypothetical protein